MTHRSAFLSRLFAAFVVCAALAACTSPTRDARGLPNDGGKTSREVCTESCNHDFDVCMDSGSQVRANDHADPSIFGTSAGCSGDLKDCLGGCRGAGLDDGTTPPPGQ